MLNSRHFNFHSMPSTIAINFDKLEEKKTIKTKFESFDKKKTFEQAIKFKKLLFVF